MDTTAQVQAEERAELLNAELSHWIGNLLTIVGAIADRKLKSATSLPDARQALSTAQGRVTCRWNAFDPADDRHFQFEWIEEKGPRVQAPERRGLGSYLIENHVAAAFRGRSRLDFAPTGLRYTLSAADPLLVVQSLALSQACSR